MTVVATSTISYSVLEEAALQAFMSSLTGPVVLPGDADYDEVRKVFNAHIDRRPAVIARPLNTNDVVESVRFARATGLPVAVRGGGHSVAGHSVIEDGLLIDLSLMKQIAVRLSDRIAVAQPRPFAVARAEPARLEELLKRQRGAAIAHHPRVPRVGARAPLLQPHRLMAGGGPVDDPAPVDVLQVSLLTSGHEPNRGHVHLPAVVALELPPPAAGAGRQPASRSRNLSARNLRSGTGAAKLSEHPLRCGRDQFR